MFWNVLNMIWLFFEKFLTVCKRHKISGRANARTNSQTLMKFRILLYLNINSIYFDFCAYCSISDAVFHSLLNFKNWQISASIVKIYVQGSLYQKNINIICLYITQGTLMCFTLTILKTVRYRILSHGITQNIYLMLNARHESNFIFVSLLVNASTLFLYP